MNPYEIRPLNPGRTLHIFDDGHLTQIQHKRTHVDIVDHFDKGPEPFPCHVVTRIRADGSIEYTAEW